MKRGFTIVMAVGLAIFCAAIITVYVSIGSIIIDTIEEKGTDITQTGVTLKEADYSSSTGLTALVQLKVKNPTGFKSKYAFSFDKIELWIDPETLGNDILHIKSLVLVAPEIVYEFSRSTDNLRTLKSHIEQSVQIALEKTIPEKKILVDNYYVRNGVLVVEAEELKGLRKTAQIGDIHIEGIGKREEGLIPAELIYQLMLPLLREATLAALNTDLSLSDQTRNLLNGAADETNKAVKALKNLLGQ